MTESTLTGLLPSVTITLKKQRKRMAPRLDFQSCVRPVVLEVKPLANYFNPFGGGCSLLCNHPVETDLRTFSPPARQRLHTRGDGSGRRKHAEDRKEAAGRRCEILVEKMGRQVGGMLQRMGAPCSAHQGKPSRLHRPTLVLDLCRSHSTDNIPASSHVEGVEGGKQSAASLSAATVSSARTPLPSTKEEIDGLDDGKDDEAPRRRGRKVKKKKKSSQEKTPRQPSVGMLEPNETQISTYSEGMYRMEDGRDKEMNKSGNTQYHQTYTPPQCSIFDLATLRHLRRNMAAMDPQSEYSKVWKRVLNEVTKSNGEMPDENDHEMNLPHTEPDQWINLPRLYSLSSARFQLPLDRNTLNFMEPLEYLREHVVVAKGKKMLYNHVFLKYSSDPSQAAPPSEISTKCLWDGLGEVVGKQLDKKMRQNLWQYLDWDEEEATIDLLTWYGLCAFTERIIGQETEGRSHVEEADFELLPRILTTVSPSEKLTNLLKTIHSIGETTSVSTSPNLWKNLLHLQINHTTLFPFSNQST